MICDPRKVLLFILAAPAAVLIITPWHEISALICNFTREIAKLPWQPLRTSQCQDGDEVLKCRD